MIHENSLYVLVLLHKHGCIFLKYNWPFHFVADPIFRIRGRSFFLYMVRFNNCLSHKPKTWGWVTTVVILHFTNLISNALLFCSYKYKYISCVLPSCFTFLINLFEICNIVQTAFWIKFKYDYIIIKTSPDQN